jgi:hypothetical protein
MTVGSEGFVDQPCSLESMLAAACGETSNREEQGFQHCGCHEELLELLAAFGENRGFFGLAVSPSISEGCCGKRLRPARFDGVALALPFLSANETDKHILNEVQVKKGMPGHR